MPSDEAVPIDYRITLPPGWIRVPVQQNPAETIALLARQHAAALPVGMQESGRQGLSRMLHEAVERAQQAAGIDLLLSIEPVAGVTVPASCLVSYFEPDDPWTGSVEDLSHQLLEGGMAVEVRELSAGLAVRRAGSRLDSLDALTGDPADEGPPVVITEVGYWFRVPGRSGMLSLTFSTAVPELGEALTGLFDAIAETFWWVRA